MRPIVLIALNLGRVFFIDPYIPLNTVTLNQYHTSTLTAVTTDFPSAIYNQTAVAQETSLDFNNCY